MRWQVPQSSELNLRTWSMGSAIEKDLVEETMQHFRPGGQAPLVFESVEAGQMSAAQVTGDPDAIIGQERKTVQNISEPLRATMGG
jgi:hypothetical protein